MKPKKIPLKEVKDGELAKAKRRIKRLEKENTKLKSELKAYDRAFDKTKDFLIDSQDEFSVEETIRAAKKSKSLGTMRQGVKIGCNKCPSYNVKLSPLPFGILVTCNDCENVYVKKEKELRTDSEIEEEA